MEIIKKVRQTHNSRMTQQQHSLIFKLKNENEKITWADIEREIKVSASHCRNVYVKNKEFVPYRKKKNYEKANSHSFKEVENLDFSSKENPEMFCIEKWRIFHFIN